MRQKNAQAFEKQKEKRGYDLETFKEFVKAGFRLLFNDSSYVNVEKINLQFWWERLTNQNRRTQKRKQRKLKQESGTNETFHERETG